MKKAPGQQRYGGTDRDRRVEFCGEREHLRYAKQVGGDLKSMGWLKGEYQNIRYILRASGVAQLLSGALKLAHENVRSNACTPLTSREATSGHTYCAPSNAAVMSVIPLMSRLAHRSSALVPARRKREADLRFGLRRAESESHTLLAH